MVPYTSPVVYRDKFYLLREEGNIGVYDYHEDMFAIFPVKPRHFVVTYEVQERDLVESEGEILVVLIGKCNPPIEIIRLDQQALSWERVTILGSQTLFLGPQVSILVNLSMKRMENIVFRSRFLKLPEVSEAELRICEGRMFIVPEYSSCCNLEERRKGSTKGHICTYSLQSGRYSRYQGSEKYIFSIWYKPTLQEDRAQALANMTR